MEPRTVTDASPAPAFGQVVKAARGGMSVRAAARAADISEARWRQLENGYQVVAKDHRVPVRPSERTVRAMAKVVGLDLRTAFEAAGLPIPPDASEPPAPPDDERPVHEIEEELGAIFATRPGISPAEREAAKRIALGSVRAYLETLEEREGR